MNKKFYVIKKGAVCRVVFCSMMILCLFTLYVPALFAQTNDFSQMSDPDFEAKVDSLINDYLNSYGGTREVAEKRIRGSLSPMLLSPSLRAGSHANNANPNSIEVNRNPTYRGYTPQQLIENIFVKGGACSSVSDIKLKTHGWNGTQWTAATNYDNRGLGYFSKGNSIFEFSEGLVLSTGGLASIEGPNQTFNNIAGPVGTVPIGDEDLEPLVSRPVTNVTILEFDFVPIGNKMVFNYVFASEEYLEYANDIYNDVFGFFVSKKSNPNVKTNIALLPDSTVVSINNVNWGRDVITRTSLDNNLGTPTVVNHNCITRTNAGARNPDYYINIPVSGTTNPTINCPVVANTRADSLRRSMELDGRTVTLTASFDVDACDVYHLKLAVGNVQDQLFQSAVFLEAYSFDVGDFLVNWGSMNRGQDYLYRGCEDNMFELIRVGSGSNSDPLPVTLEYGGTALGNIEHQGGGPMPTTVIIPAGKDTVQVYYKVNWNNLGSGEKDLIIKVNCPCGGEYTEKIIKLYDPSDLLQATATYACQDVNNGSIIVTGVGGSGFYESSIDGGETWLPHTTDHVGLPPDTFNVLIRDVGGCSMVTRTVSTIMYTTITGGLNVCPPSYSTILTASDGGTGVDPYQWYKDGVAIQGATAQTVTVTSAGKYSVTMRNGPCYSNLGDTVVVSSTNCLFAEPDFAQTLKDIPVKIPVLDNDMLSVCHTLSPTILPPVLNGVAVVNGDTVIFTPTPGFIGKTIFRYQIECDGVTSDTTITVVVQPYPDNVIDVDCYVDSIPPIPFSFKEITTLRSPLENIHSLATPLAGDIDGDGLIEIVVATRNGTISTNGLHIFKIHKNDSISLLQTLETPWYMSEVGASYAIANVDGGPYSAIFLATDNCPDSPAKDKMQLIKYTYDGTKYIESVRRGYGGSAARQAPVPVIADINGDSIAEIVVYDKVYNARTMTLIADGGFINDGTKGFGEGAHTNDRTTEHSISSGSYLVLADMDGDGILEVCGGNSVYKVNITNPNGLVGNSFTLWSQCNRMDLDGNMHDEAYDGTTSVADLDGDGMLDIVASVRRNNNRANPNMSAPRYGALYSWNPRTGKVMNTNVIADLEVDITTARYAAGASIAFIGDIDNDGEPEVCITARKKMYAYKYNKNAKTLDLFWEKDTNDESAATTMVLFDFNQDGQSELVYRDMTHLRIIKGMDGTDLVDPIACASHTGSECPIVADVNGDGSAEIIVTGRLNTSPTWYGYLRVFASNPAGLWAPARNVWNQFAYNAVNVNNDLTIPAMQLNPATVFPNGKRPYNAFLQQQTVLNMGVPVWLTPDVYPANDISSATVTENSVSVKIGVVNQGDAAIGPPVYATLYKDSISQANIIAMDSANIQIHVGDTGYVNITIPDIRPYMPFLNIVVRVNDKNGEFMYQLECNDDNNELTILNPAIGLLMRKDATLLGTTHNGTYPNPISVLFGEEIEYTITAVNASMSTGTVTVVDTIPAYLKYVTSSADNGGVHSYTNLITPQCDILTWTLANVPSLGTRVVKFKATPVDGSSASQPLFINSAWVKMGALSVPTNSTYHQGAGISITTFSAGLGGQIYNATEQAIDYMTAPRSGIVIVPEEGYCFTGWSHDDYISLRGKTIEARVGITHYDTLIVYGNVELRANFELEEYPVHYYLNGSSNAENNPATYTIKSGVITLGTPQKPDDVFIGWTGSNGDDPQPIVTIPNGSTGELEYYANFLYSGRENNFEKQDLKDEKIWTVKDELYVRSSRIGSVVRIYSMEGVLQKQHTIVTPGETKIKLPKGLYVVTLNKDPGQIVNVE